MSCAVAKCKSVRRLTIGNKVKFHRFPVDAKLRSKWKEALGLGDNWKYTPNKFVCSRHFCKRDYFVNSGHLLRNATPSQNLDDDDRTKQNNKIECIILDASLPVDSKSSVSIKPSSKSEQETLKNRKRKRNESVDVVPSGDSSRTSKRFSCNKCDHYKKEYDLMKRKYDNCKNQLGSAATLIRELRSKIYDLMRTVSGTNFENE